MPGRLYFEFPEGMVAKVAECLGTTEKSLDEDVVKLKDWLKTQRHLPEVPGDHILRNFVILNKGSVELAKQKIDMYYTVRTLLPNVYEKINPKLPNIKEVMDAVYYLTLPKVTEDLYRVFWFKVKNKALIDDVDINDLVRLITNIAELRLNDDVMYGAIFVIDCKDLTLKFIMKLTPTIVYNVMVTIFEKVFSSRLRAIYVINAIPLIERVVQIAKAVMKEKLFKRIHISHDTTVLNEKISKDMLPKDYGGEEMSLEEIEEMLKEMFIEYQDRFEKLDKLRVDESLRPAKLKNDDILGYHGNFKALEVD